MLLYFFKSPFGNFKENILKKTLPLWLPTAFLLTSYLFFSVFLAAYAVDQYFVLKYQMKDFYLERVIRKLYEIYMRKFIVIADQRL